MKPIKTNSLPIMWAFIITGFAIVVFLSGFIAYQHAYQVHNKKTKQSLSEFTDFIDQKLTEFNLQLDVISLNPSLTILDEPLSHLKKDVTNRLLAGLAGMTTRELLLLNTQGIVVAHSSWQQKHYLIDQPYWLDTPRTSSNNKSPNTYLDIDIHTGRRHLVLFKLLNQGALVLKISIDELETDWKSIANNPDADYFIALDNATIFFATDYSALFKTLPLVVLPPVDASFSFHQYTTSQQLIPLSNSSDRLTEPAIERSIWTSYKGRQGWLLSNFITPKNVIDNALSTAVYGGLIYIILGLLFAFKRERDRRTKVLHMHNTQLEEKVAIRTQELRNMQRELIQAEKLAVIGELSASLSHELSQPITAIRSFSTNAKAFLEKKRYPLVLDNLEEITVISHHMAAIIQRFKTFSRKDVVLKPVSIKQLCDRTISMLSEQLSTNQITMELSIDSIEDSHIHGDWVLLEQVLVNLICNAIDATAGQTIRKILLTGETKDLGISLSVIDNGKGLSDKVKEQLFQPFFTTKPNNQGLGLGLAIAQKMVKLMDATIYADNSGSCGAILTLWLPLYEKSR